MNRAAHFRRVLPAAAVGLLLTVGLVQAQAPAEVAGVAVSASGQVSWSPVAGADTYHVYWDRGSSLGSLGRSLSCHAFEVGAGPWDSADDPLPGQAVAYLVTAESLINGEGTAGLRSDGAARYFEGACRPLITHHILNRAGMGWSQWERNRISLLGGMDAYLDEQLDPSSIPENSDFLMSVYLLQYDPPLDGIDLLARHVIFSHYSYRQLAHKLSMFWFNHFNTDWEKVRDYYAELFPSCEVSSVSYCDPDYPYLGGIYASSNQHRDMLAFLEMGLGSTFREILETGSLSTAMMIYLDGHLSEVLKPNENQPREALELHSMGVDGGYTQQDVEELSRVMTGWGVCKKVTADLGDPLAACLTDYWLTEPVGDFTTHFDISRHDCSSKTLFAGTPQELILPGTAGCSSPADAAAAIAEFGLALDAIADHPSTKRFISRKLIELLVTDEPTEAMIDQVVAVWNDSGNPQGIGDLREVTRAVLNLDALRDPSFIGTKVKTPLEQIVSSLRALRGRTDGTTVVLETLRNSQHLLFFNEIPTGFSERGSDWISTGSVLERQNWGINLASIDYLLGFGIDPVQVLEDSGVSTAPGNAAAIVDKLAELLFGGRLSPEHRQVAIDFLNTDNFGTVSPYDEFRIRETTALLLGYPHFQEQ